MDRGDLIYVGKRSIALEVEGGAVKTGVVKIGLKKKRAEA